MTYLYRKGNIFGKYFAVVFNVKSWLLGGEVDAPLLSINIGPVCVMWQWRPLVILGEEDATD